MGLIKAGMGALGGTLADQWKEFFYCDSLDKDVLMVKGQKRTSRRSSNNGEDNIITNGSGIAVADGQCMLIVEQGRVVEVCAEPGEFTFDASTEPSVFTGNFGDSLAATFQTVAKRFTYGGDTGKDQRVYYINTKELIDNKFGTPNPIPFRVVDNKIGLDIDVSVRCSGVYSYKIADPLLFYTNVCGNVESEYTRDELDGQLKTEFISALQPAFGKLSDLELRPNQIVSHNTELEEAMNAALSAKWGELRGLKVGLMAAIPSAIGYIVLVLSKLGVCFPKYIFLYRFANVPFMPIINSMVSTEIQNTAQVPWPAILAMLMVVAFVPLVCHFAYFLGYKQISLSEKFIYINPNKKKKRRRW